MKHCVYYEQSCEHAIQEPWPKGKTAYRCMHEGSGRVGRVVYIVSADGFTGKCEAPKWCRAEEGNR